MTATPINESHLSALRIKVLEAQIEYQRAYCVRVRQQINDMLDGKTGNRDLLDGTISDHYSAQGKLAKLQEQLWDETGPHK